ncbi:hypothetical protein [Chryseobacterium salivictor]
MSTDAIANHTAENSSDLNVFLKIYLRNLIVNRVKLWQS